MVKCGFCSVTWHQMPVNISSKKITESINKNLSIEEVKASDGKIYKFIGNQWAVLLPSGKTGLFAKKKIGKELDSLTGRIVKKNIKKKQNANKEVNPSESISAEVGLPDIYQPKNGIGFFGYFFLLIIIGFSLVGIAKTFENDLLNKFPETQYFFYILDEQLIYIAETIKNIIVIISDLINSY
jgi:hypothetical protein